MLIFPSRIPRELSRRKLFVNDYLNYINVMFYFGLIKYIIINEEKNLWALKANYTSYAGLLRYLKGNPKSQCYARVYDAAVEVIG